MILTRLFTVALLMMISMVAKADVKVLFGEDGKELEPGKNGTITLPQKEVTGGTIIITQEDQKDGTFKVFLSVTPDNGYSMAKDGPEVWAAIPTDINSTSTRAVTASTKLDLKSDDYKDIYQKRTYYVTIDSKLALWVRSADFKKKRDGAKEGDEPIEPTEIGPITLTQDPTNPVYYLLQNVGNKGIKAFYAMPYDNGDEIRITTTNVPNSDMRFYFMYAGNDGTNDYFYMIHWSGKYLYAKGSANVNGGARLKALPNQPTEDEIKRYMFRIELYNGGGYYIINKSLGETAPLCKRGGNTFISDKNSGDNYYFLKLNTYTPRDDFFRWNFIPISKTNPLVWTPPFTLSTEESRSYYNIQNRINTSHYISINDSKKVTTTETNNDNRVWYFEEVPVGENGSDEYITYYYIVHALTGRYMCFDGNPETSSDQTEAASIQIKTESNEQKCQFIVTRSGENADPEYFNCIPKALKSYYWNSQCIALYKTESGSRVYTRSDRNDTKTARWIFGSPIEYTNVCATPTISCTNTGVVTIESTTDGSVIYYTTDGTRPTTSSTQYDGTFTISATTTIKAIATKDGVTQSLVATETFSKVATPTVINNGTQIVISCDTEGATKYFSTNGGGTYTEYTEPLDASSYLTQTIVAKATKAEWIDSETYSLHIDATCNMPTFTLDYTTGIVTISSTTEEAQIYYTINGIDPGETPGDGEGATLGTSLTLTSAKTVKARAYKEGFSPSAVASVAYSQVATPSIQNNGSNAISITCTTGGASIHYEVGDTEASTNDPTSSSVTYGSPLTENVSGKVIKAKAFKTGMVPSSTGENTVTLQCNKPIITKGANLITISCDFPASDYTIYYSVDGSDPTNEYPEGGISYTDYGFTVRAVVKATNYSNSDEASRLIMPNPDGQGTQDEPYLIHSGEFAKFVAKAEEEPGAYFRLVQDIEATDDVISTPFTGTFEAEASSDNSGNFYKISGLTHALFNTISGGTVKNVLLEGVNISTGTNVGAIANVVEGTSTKIASIYNCGILSGSVGGSGYVGGIVGLLGNTTDDSKCYARVINCYSYATVGGGSDKGGIVGYNSYASKDGDIRTMVMNCLFLGSIADGGYVSPVYGGVEINNLNGGETNKGLNTYNYYRYATNKNISANKYNCALAVKDQYLTRFEIYRQLLNSNRKLAAWYATGDANNGVGENNEMAKWVLDRTIKPYPILKAQKHYYSIVNYDPNNTFDKASGTNVSRSNISARNKGKNTGTLTVHISKGAYGSIKSGKDEYDLQRTDKDYDSFNFNYDKVQLPYFNEVGTGNYEKYDNKYRVVTGWKITGFDGGTAGNYTAGSDIGNDGKTPYNFADRNCTNKDLYGTNGSNRVFSQGAYFDVPYGVTDIYIEAYWGQAAFICDQKMDVVYDANTESPASVTEAQGNPLIPGTPSPTIHTSVSSALGTLNGSSVYDNALVLVGNLHLNNVPSNGGKAFTIMSADFDQDNEPDYSLIYTHFGTPSGRKAVSPIRFDFLNVPGTAMAQKPKGAEFFRNVGIFNPKGWFEITNTCLISFVQFEYDNGSKSAAPLILLGGEFEQFVSTQNKTPDVTEYIHVGGNAWFKEFNNGTHSDGSSSTKHIPISATGGDYDKFYLSGAYRPDAATVQDDAEGYISGGRFGEMAGAGQQQIDGNVYWQIYDADITDFYGGGINSEKPITGNITVDMYNSHVTTYCGGPKFGNNDDKVTTNATSCTFTNYYGAGYGGIAYIKKRTRDVTDYDFSGWQADYTNNKGKYFNGSLTTIGDKNEKAGPGVAVDFDYEFFVWSSGATGGRFYIKYASLSFATTKDVESILNNCDITESFYGGGRLGKVDGTINSTLNGCRVTGNVFGAGYSAERPKVPYRNGGFKDGGVPKIDTDAGVFADGEKVDINASDYLELNPDQTLSNGESAIGTSGKIDTDFTEDNLKALGTVSGVVTLNINNYTANSNTIQTVITGNVFGGGAMSQTTSDVNVNITDGSVRNVYGGGDEGAVGGNTVVTLSGSTTVNGNVFGGGNQAPVSGSATVNIVEQ